MSPTSYQAAPPREATIAERRGQVKFPTLAEVSSNLRRRTNFILEDRTQAAAFFFSIRSFRANNPTQDAPLKTKAGHLASSWEGRASARFPHFSFHGLFCSWANVNCPFVQRNVCVT